MTMQLNIGEVRYAPSRDINYLFPQVILNVADRLEDGPFKPLHAWLEREGITMDDLGEAQGAYIRYMNAAHQDPDKKMFEVLEESGWNKCHWQAQVAVMYYTGIMMTGTFFKGIRDATPLGGDAITPTNELINAAKTLDWYLSMPSWQQWFYRRFKWLRKLLRRGKGIHREV